MLKHLPAVGFEGASIIMQVGPTHSRDETIGYPGGQLAAQTRVLAMLAPATDNIVALVQLLQETRNIYRVVLKIAIHENQHLAGAMMNTGRNGGGLPIVTTEPDNVRARVRCCQFAQLLKGIIATAIINVDDFVSKWLLF